MTMEIITIGDDNDNENNNNNDDDDDDGPSGGDGEEGGSSGFVLCVHNVLVIASLLVGVVVMAA
eukprot:CAMPEP_0201514756 /NCGR_PEP_ID=MMETSP0161_2-20130828/6509_1 /ASSEMBLY_ACC=CAM_ASM_000251 /TAXON_ID=180227 /ORGANISM="Neoparamoeba aestuarina, Strain SoJaBio B1-5/56/2" /LENGTH=63 /DNA_ID=CAMNT_0047911399 /DNA_START=291 /DNA_END=483 /DNA_ORIENTATION=+